MLTFAPGVLAWWYSPKGLVDKMPFGESTICLPALRGFVFLQDIERVLNLSSNYIVIYYYCTFMYRAYCTFMYLCHVCICCRLVNHYNKLSSLYSYMLHIYHSPLPPPTLSLPFFTL